MPTAKRNAIEAIEEQEMVGTRKPNSPLMYDAPGPHEISELAHQLWIERGCPEGSPEEDWFKAEEELLHAVP